jgi:hypothetical protein
MRRLARSMRAEAERLAVRSAWLNRRVGRLKFEGPAADDLRQAMLTSQRAAERAAADLKDIANRILSGASRVESDIADWHRRAVS